MKILEIALNFKTIPNDVYIKILFFIIMYWLHYPLNEELYVLK